MYPAADRLNLPVSLDVTQLELGPIGTNCYLVRAARRRRGGRRRPGRRRARDPPRACRPGRPLRRDPDHARPLGSPRRRRRPGRGDGRPGAHGRGRSGAARADQRLRPSGGAAPPVHPDVLLQGDETLELAGITFETLRVPGHSPAHLAFAADGCLFSGDVLFAGSVGRTDLPGADWDLLEASIGTLVDRFPPETVVYSGPRARDDARSRAGTNPFLGRASGYPTVKIEAPRGTHDVLPVRTAALAAGHRQRPRSSASSTATGGSRRLSSRTPSSSSGRPAPAPTSCRRRCTRSRTRAAAP